MSNSKKIITRTMRSRNWTQDEINLLARILADPDENFLCPLEQKALNHSANSEVFGIITRPLLANSEVFGIIHSSFISK